MAGKEKALIIDTMNGYEDVKAIAKTLTDLPLTVVNTHGHPDHIFGNVYFDEVYMHPDDWELARNYTKIPEFQKAVGQRNLKFPPLLPVKEGDIFDLGGVTLEVYHTYQDTHLEESACWSEKIGFYSLNEITIYWNSPAIFVAAFLTDVNSYKERNKI